MIQNSYNSIVLILILRFYVRIYLYAKATFIKWKLTEYYCTGTLILPKHTTSDQVPVVVGERALPIMSRFITAETLAAA